MQRVSRDRFLADPPGRSCSGASWVYLCPREGLFGFALWGRPA